MLPPLPVLGHFGPHVRGLSWRRAASGFSGAAVWRGDDAVGPRVALKMWPSGFPVERLTQIHTWMDAAKHLRFVPGVLGVAFEHDGRVWDCCRWMPGDPRPAPDAEGVRRACAAVAELHKAWAAFRSGRGPSPGVRNRLRALAENESLLRAGPDSLPPVAPELDLLLRRAVQVAAHAAPGAVATLRPWEDREFLLHPCARDLRGEHVLFSADAVGGIVDYGAAAVDHAGGDLARLLGDYAEHDGALFEVGLDAYRAARPALDAPDDFVRLLAHSGAVCSVLGWLARLVVRREPVSDAAAVKVRLAQLVARVGRNARF